MYLIDNNFYFETENVTEEKYLQRVKISLNWWNRKEKLSKNMMLELYGGRIINTFDIIYRLRAANAFVLALSVVVFYFIMLTTFGSVFWICVSLVATFFYGHNMIFLEKGIFATDEAMFVLFFNVGIFFMIKIFSGSKRRVVYLWGYAASAAFCTQAKLNGMMLSFFFSTLYLAKLSASYFARFKINIKKSIILLVLVNILSFCIFTLCDPYLYQNTLSNIGNYYSHRWARTLIQTKNEDYIKVMLPNYMQRIAAVYNNFIGNNVNMDLSFVSYDFPFGKFQPPRNLLIVLLATGIFSTIIKTIREKNVFSANFLILLFFIMTQFIMGFYLMFNFSRYFIQLIAFFLFFEINGAIYISKLIIQSTKKLVVNCAC